ncbi:unnamed protein product [[Candida] boidinii]|nr:unnamed protein product [[Candida] boidinii]
MCLAMNKKLKMKNHTHDTSEETADEDETEEESETGKQVKETNANNVSTVSSNENTEKDLANNDKDEEFSTNNTTDEKSKDSTESPKASTSFSEKQNVIFIQEFPSDATSAAEDKKPISQISKPVMESNGEVKDAKHDGDSTIESSPVEIREDDIEVKEEH